MTRQRLHTILHLLTTPIRATHAAIIALAARIAPPVVSAAAFGNAVEAATAHRIRATGPNNPIGCTCTATFPRTPAGRRDANAHVAAKIIQAAGVEVDHG